MPRHKAAHCAGPLGSRPLRPRRFRSSPCLVIIGVLDLFFQFAALVGPLDVSFSLGHVLMLSF